MRVLRTFLFLAILLAAGRADAAEPVCRTESGWPYGSVGACADAEEPTLEARGRGLLVVNELDAEADADHAWVRWWQGTPFVVVSVQTSGSVGVAACVWTHPCVAKVLP